MLDNDRHPSNPLPPPPLMRTTNYCARHDSSFVDGVFIPQGAAQSLAEKIAYPPRRAPIATWREKLTDNGGRSDKREAPSDV